MSLAALIRSDGTRSEILTLDLELPLRGVWTAVVETGDDEAPSGRVTIEITGEEDEVDRFVGTIPAGAGGSYQGRTGLFIVGGAAGLDITLAPRDYFKVQGVDVETILQGIAEDTGETLAPLPQLAGRRVDAWHVGGVTGAQALSLLADRLGVEWRLLADGTIWLGADDYLAADALASFVGPIDREARTIACRPSSGRLRPGVTVAGERVTGVRYTVRDGLHAELAYGTPTEREEFRAAVEGVTAPATYARVYPARIAEVRGNGRLDVVADDAAVGPVAAVTLLAGMPGAKLTPVEGDRVRLVFEAASPERRVAVALEQDREAGRPVHRVGDAGTAGRLWVENTQSPAPPGLIFSIQAPGAPIRVPFAVVSGAVTVVPNPASVELVTRATEGSEEVLLR